MRFLTLSFLVLLFTGCFRKNPNWVEPMNKVWGNKPIYGVDSNLKKVSYSPAPFTVKDAGNIYAKGGYLYQVETGRGIHIINNTVPANAARIAFISIPGCSQISIKGNILYSNNFEDLVMVDISSITAIREVARKEMAFPTGRAYYPFSEPDEPGNFECPNGEQLVIGWTRDSIQASCYKN
jgi:hypothetical protein